MNKVFSDLAWEEYLYWQLNDRKLLKKINDLLKDIERNGNEGLGKPEPLRHELEGLWSRRISPEHRLIYKFDEENIYILKCKTHYE
ncbi:MAG: Txe/YoeB family addiction module toxin [Negativicutes bacterium]|nr:Txe/YoeB family addiction module toxin [Negativicutes bacterium]